MIISSEVVNLNASVTSVLVSMTSDVSAKSRQSVQVIRDIDGKYQRYSG
jgi:hypothetical protein